MSKFQSGWSSLTRIASFKENFRKFRNKYCSGKKKLEMSILLLQSKIIFHKKFQTCINFYNINYLPLFRNPVSVCHTGTSINWIYFHSLLKTDVSKCMFIQVNALTSAYIQQHTHTQICFKWKTQTSKQRNQKQKHCVFLERLDFISLSFKTNIFLW